MSKLDVSKAGGSGREELKRKPSSFPAVLRVVNVREKTPDIKKKIFLSPDPFKFNLFAMLFNSKAFQKVST